MRRSAGGCYEIDGTALRRVMDDPTGTVSPARWRERQADLWVECGRIAHLDHHLTAEENGLWRVMWAELKAVDATVSRLDGDVTP
ncbi:MAG: hypothetical protein EHM24_17075 [Acidobacteria bacterium]|nr:MAG: hypothetical protein EHM24_17075 [Acidobacteriota bacterium]